MKMAMEGGRCGEMWEMWGDEGDVGRCGKLWDDVGRCGEICGDVCGGHSPMKMAMTVNVNFIQNESSFSSYIRRRRPITRPPCPAEAKKLSGAM